MRSTTVNLDPYSATRPFDPQGYEPAFDFAAQGQDLGSALDEGASRRKKLFKAPEQFTFRESTSPRTQVDPYTKGVQEFRRGAGEDDLLLGLLGQGIEATGTASDPIDWAKQTVGGFTEGKSLPRVMGSIVSELPERGVKAAATGLKGGMAAFKALKGAGLAKTLGDIGIAGASEGIGKAILPAAFARNLSQIHRLPLRTANAIENAVSHVPEADLDELLKKGASKANAVDLWDIGNINPVDEDAVNAMVKRAKAGITPLTQRRKDIVANPVSRSDYNYTLPGMADLYPGRTFTPTSSSVGGASPKIIWRTDTGEHILHKTTPFDVNASVPLGGGQFGMSSSAFYGAPEHAGSQLANLLNPRVPIATPVREGGTVQTMVGFPGQYPTIGSTPGVMGSTTPNTAHQMIQSHVDDTLLRNMDPHSEQFLVHPGGDITPVDKGYNNLADYRVGVSPDPQRVAERGSSHTYLGLQKGGRFNRYFDPQIGMDRAEYMKSIPDVKYEEALEPMLDYQRLTNPKRQEFMDNFFRARDEIPMRLQRYYDEWMR